MVRPKPISPYSARDHELAARLRQWMASHRYTIREMAGDCEFSSDLVSKALAGQMRRSPTAVLERLCAAVGLRVSLTEQVQALAPMDSVVAALRGLIQARQVCEAQVTRHGATAHVVYLSCIAHGVGHQTRPFVVRRPSTSTTTTVGA